MEKEKFVARKQRYEEEPNEPMRLQQNSNIHVIRIQKGERG